ncbi:MAG: MarR family transcriptional regulator, partial [Fibrobacteria bacterium]
YFNTTALARLLEREWTKAFKPFGLTPSQAFLLRVVLEKPGLLQSELAAEMAISRSTATRTLDGLQHLKLLQRVATERDGRESAIHPTSQGLAIKDKLNTASGEVTRRLKKELGAAHFDDTVANVKGVRSTLE